MATFQIIPGCDPHWPGSSVTGLVFLPECFLLQSAAGFCLTAATSVWRPLGAAKKDSPLPQAREGSLQRNSDFPEEGSPFCQKAASLDSRSRVQPEGLGRADPACSAPPRGRWKGSQTSLEPPPVLVRLGAAGTGGPGWSWQWWTVEAPGGRCQECGRTASPWRLGRRQLLPMQRRDGQVWGSQSRGWNKWADASAPSWTCAFSLCASVVLLPPFPCPGLEGRDVQGRRDTLVVWFLQCPGLADGTRAQAQLPWQGLGGLWCFTGAQGAVGWAHPGPSSQGCGASFGHGHFASVKCRPIKLHYLF